MIPTNIATSTKDGILSIVLSREKRFPAALFGLIALVLSIFIYSATHHWFIFSIVMFSLLILTAYLLFKRLDSINEGSKYPFHKETDP